MNISGFGKCSSPVGQLAASREHWRENMKSLLLASAALLGTASQGFSLTLPPTYAPTPTSFSAAFEQGVTGSSGTGRSPFDTTTTPNAPYDVVLGNSSSDNLLGIGATFDPSAFTGSSGTAGTFTFVDGSPDTYNSLIFNLVGGGTNIFMGSQIAPTSGAGVAIVTLAGIGDYSSVSFASTSDSFEFAALAPVPLPPSAAMFGTALVALGVVGFRMKSKKAAAA